MGIIGRVLRIILLCIVVAVAFVIVGIYLRQAIATLPESISTGNIEPQLKALFAVILLYYCFRYMVRRLGKQTTVTELPSVPADDITIQEQELPAPKQEALTSQHNDQERGEQTGKGTPSGY